MVLLTVVTTSNPHTLYFDHPIEKPNYIRLLSASLYNSWYNLAENGTMSVRRAAQGGGQSSGASSPTYVSITAGHYTPESMAKAITEAFKKENIDIAVETRTSLGVMNILNPKNMYSFTLSNNLKALFGVSLQVNSNILVRRFDSKNLTSFTATWLTKDRTCSTASLLLCLQSWMSKVSHTPKSPTKQYNLMFCATQTAVTTM